MDNNQPTNPWTPEPTPTQQTIESRAPRRRVGRAVALVAAGAVGASVLTGIAFADDTTPSPNPGATGSYTGPMPGGMGDRDERGGPDGERKGRHGKGGPMGMLGKLGGRVLHGEAVVAKRDGSTATVRMQTGKVDSASADSLAVTSSDGYEQTWAITADTKVHRDGEDVAITDIKAGDTVMVVGEVSGSSVTTMHVRALSPERAAEMEARRQQHREQHEDDDAPAPSPSAS